MRALSYLFVGYLLLSMGASGLFLGSAAGVVTALVAAAGLVALVRSYRTGRPRGKARSALAYDARAGAARLAEQVGALHARLPADPLGNAGFVAASYDVRSDADALRDAEARYAEWRRRLERAEEDVHRLGADADRGASPVLLDEELRLAAELRSVDAYADALDERAARATDDALT